MDISELMLAVLYAPLASGFGYVHRGKVRQGVSHAQLPQSFYRLK